MRYYTLAQVARLLGVCTRTLKRWEEAGLVRFQRNVRDHRILDEASLAELKSWAVKERVLGPATSSPRRHRKMRSARYW